MADEKYIPSFDEAMSNKYVPSFDDAMKMTGQPAPAFKANPNRSAEGFGGYGAFGAQDVWSLPPSHEYWQKAHKYIEQQGPEEALGEAGEWAGGTIGTVGGPVGIIAGRTIGAGIFGAAGWNISQDIRESQGEPEIGVGGRLKGSGKAFLRQGGATLAGEGIGALAKKAAAPFRSKLIPEAVEMSKLAEHYGTHLTPGQLTDAWAADTLETIADASFFGGRGMKKLKLRSQPQAIGKYAEDLADQFTQRMKKVLDPDAIGRYADDVLTGRKRQFMKQAEALYSNLDDISGNVKVDISELRRFTLENLSEAREFFGVGATEAGDSLLHKVAQIGGEEIELDFRAARKLRTRLMGEEDKAIAKKMTSLLDNAMEKAAKQEGGDLYTAWREVNRFYKKGAETYNNKLIQGLVKTVQDKGEPEKIIPYVFKNKSVSRIKTVKQAVGGMDSKAWRMLKAKYVENLLDVKPGKLIGSNLPDAMYNMGDQALKEIFHPEEIAALTRMGKWANLVGGRSSKEMATGGSMVVQLVQGGAVLSVLSGKFKEIATPVFVLPEVVSQLATHKSTAKWLSEGFDIPANTAQGQALANRILISVRRFQAEQQSERMRERPAFQSRFMESRFR